MGIFSDYKAYKKYEPQYKEWKTQKDFQEAQKLEYLKSNPVDKKTKHEEIQRGKALLRAIDVMDEYSQAKAENMEVATKQTLGIVSEAVYFAGIALGFAASKIPIIKRGLSSLAQKYPKVGGILMYLPIGIGMLGSLITQMCMQGWAASKEVGASRKGRFEAMKDELADPKNFAVLNDEQIKQQSKIAAKIPTTKDMKKGVQAKRTNLLNPLNIVGVYSDMLTEDKKYQAEREKFNKKLYAGENKETKLSETDILKAKKDQQLLHNVIEKIDMASQDYAENVELATQTITTLSFAGGALTGWITNKLLSLFKVASPKARRITSWIVGIGLSVGTTIWATQIQKQASRVGRYLAKKDIEKDLNNFVYVDKEKTKNIKNAKIVKKEKPNFFRFMLQVFKDNLQYKKHIKTEGVKAIKKSMALKDIKITPEQEKDAKMLQKNTFKAFSKLDEKSQQYAESVEAVGEVIAAPLGAVGGLAGMGLGAWIGKHIKSANTATSDKRMMIGMFIGTIIGIIPTILNNIYFTKQQKQASRVAHMLALNEMQDYKNYVDYENLSTVKK